MGGKADVLMKYNTAVQAERKQAQSYFMTLINKKSVVEVKKINPKRSLRQNSYLHLALGLFGLETGHTLAEAKTIYKRDINPEIYVYKKGDHLFLKSSADLDTKEMTITIDRLRQFASEQGIHIPAPMDEAELRALENRLETNRQYL